MIDGYTRPELGAVWTDEPRMSAWRDVEVAAAEALDGLTYAVTVHARMAGGPSITRTADVVVREGHCAAATDQCNCDGVSTVAPRR